MKAPLFVLGLVLVSLAAVAAGVYALHDETLFVSPPEATADGLLRAISRGRVGATRAALSRDAQRATSDQEIARIADAFQARVGRVERVRSEPLRRRGDTLVVLTSVQGERADPELLLRMVREEGVWSVTHLEDVLPVGSTVPSTPR
jgi:hypothetical protein